MGSSTQLTERCSSEKGMTAFENVEVGVDLALKRMRNIQWEQCENARIFFHGNNKQNAKDSG